MADISTQPMLFKSLSVGADHAGVALKSRCKIALEAYGLQVEDLGAFDETSVDYPDIAQRVVKSIVEGRSELGLLICGSGVGMSIAANRTPMIRAALCADVRYAALARAHNDANLLVLGARLISEKEALASIEAFLTTPFEEERHRRRVDQLTAISGATP